MKTKSNMTVKKPKELDYLKEYNEWVEATGLVSKGTSYYYEIESIIENALTQQRTELLGDVSLIVRGCWVQVQSPTGDFNVIDPEKLNKELFNLLNKKDE